MKCFNIRLEGPQASGKTVALAKIEAMLNAEGYETSRNHATQAGFEHSLSVRWSD